MKSHIFGINAVTEYILYDNVLIIYDNVLLLKDTIQFLALNWSCDLLSLV